MHDFQELICNLYAHEDWRNIAPICELSFPELMRTDNVSDGLSKNTRLNQRRFRLPEIWA